MHLERGIELRHVVPKFFLSSAACFILDSRSRRMVLNWDAMMHFLQGCSFLHP
jgi:hypothetical protein